MDRCEIIELKESILEDNDEKAQQLRAELKDKGILYINVMSSPGAGKTTLISGLARILSGYADVGIMEADIDSDVDAMKLIEQGICAVQLHTGGMCHLDSAMSRQGLKAMENLMESRKEKAAEAKRCGWFSRIVILENVGNLVCPAEFDTGAHMNLVILSVPEGDDKPLKYPLIFRKCDAVCVNKTDTLPAFDFDMDRFRKYTQPFRSGKNIFPVSALKGEGLDDLADWILKAGETI